MSIIRKCFKQLLLYTILIQGINTIFIGQIPLCLFFFLTFRGPSIVIYSYIKSQRDALFLNFILVKNSTCFRQIYCPSSGVLVLYSQQLVLVMLVMLTASEVRMELHPDLASRQPTELAWQIPIAVYTVLRYSWWWTVDPSETCRVLYWNKLEK